MKLGHQGDPDVKPFYRSLTFWSLLVTLLGLALAGLARGAPLLDVLGDPEVQGTLGSILTLLGVGGAVVGRARAAGPLTLGSGDRQGRGEVAVLGTIAVALGLVALLMAGGGCLARQVTAEQSIGVDIKRGPPCVVTVTADGAVAATVTGPRCEGLPAPAVTP